MIFIILWLFLFFFSLVICELETKASPERLSAYLIWGAAQKKAEISYRNSTCTWLRGFLFIYLFSYLRKRISNKSKFRRRQQFTNQLGIGIENWEYNEMTSKATVLGVFVGPKLCKSRGDQREAATAAADAEIWNWLMQTLTDWLTDWHIDTWCWMDAEWMLNGCWMLSVARPFALCRKPNKMKVKNCVHVNTSHISVMPRNRTTNRLAPPVTTSFSRSLFLSLSRNAFLTFYWLSRQLTVATGNRRAATVTHTMQPCCIPRNANI